MTASNELLHVVYIEWSDSHTSPPIGPFPSYREAKKFATEVRKRLKAHDRPVQGRVHVRMIAKPSAARSWLPTAEETLAREEMEGWL